LKSVHLITHWHSWLSGSREKIYIGQDFILGLRDKALLSQELRDHLSRKNINLLAHAKIQQVSRDSSNYWRDSHTLGLSGILADEWDSYTRNISAAGVILGNSEDTLLWTGGDASGKATVIFFYSALVSTRNYQQEANWKQKLWKWNTLLKIKLFTWLTINRKILTWEGLQRRGWVGPGWCVFCKRNLENIEHMFIDCNFTRKVWAWLKHLLNLNNDWKGQDIIDCYLQWINDKSVFPELAAITCWGLWLERNKCVFENKALSIHSVLFKILGLFNPSKSFITKSLTKDCSFQSETGAAI
jgi:hypothetical protein